MSPRLLPFKVATAAFGGLLGLTLIFATQAPDRQVLNRYEQALDHLGELDASLNVHVLRAAGPYFHNYDQISAQATELEDLARHIANPPPSLPRRGELNGETERLAQAVTTKRRLVERFKAHNAVLKNSRAWLLASVREWDQGEAPAPRSGEQGEWISQVMGGLTELLLYDGDSAAEAAATEELTNPLRELEQRLVAASAPTATIAYLGNMRRHVEIFSRRLPRVRGLVDDIVALPLDQPADSVRALYRSQLAEMQRRASFLHTLAILSWLLAAYQLLSALNLMSRERKALRLKVNTREQQLEVELEERKKSEEALRDLAGVVSEESDASFFQTLADRLAGSLDLEVAAIGQMDGRWVKTLAMSRRGHPGEQICYELEKTPCEHVVGRGLCCFPRDVARQFPEDRMLTDLGIESYCGSPIFDAKGRATGLLSVMDTKPFDNIDRIQSVVRIASARVSDELERRRIEAAVRADRERFSVMLRSIGDGVIATDLGTRVTLINREAERLTGWPETEALGRDLTEVLEILEPGTDHLRSDLLLGVLETGETAPPNEALELRRRGDAPHDRCPVRASRAPLFDDGDRLIGAIIVFRDVSAQVRVEQEKNKIEGQLLQLQKMETIGTLAGGIAHEFNNLLTPIVGYASLSLEMPEGSPKIPGYTRKILSGATRAQKLVRQILRFGHQHTLEYRPTRLQKTLRDAAEMVRTVAPSGIELSFDLPEDLDPVLCDENQIHQVLINLCTNACHAMQPQGGTLHLSMHQRTGGPGLGLDPEADYLTIAIADTGVGMTNAVRERVFDPFFTTRNVGEGTGLGLSVALGIVKSHGGTITVESESGKGSTFTIYLPHGAGATHEAAADAAHPAPSGRRERLLFVDDEPDIVDMACDLLGNSGYKVTPCCDSLEALDIFKGSPSSFDLVITDYTMPGLKGLELGRAILNLRPELPVLLTTGYSQAVTEEKALSEGFAGLVMKPIVGNDLRRAVRAALGP